MKPLGLGLLFGVVICFPIFAGESTCTLTLRNYAVDDKVAIGLEYARENILQPVGSTKLAFDEFDGAEWQNRRIIYFDPCVGLMFSLPKNWDSSAVVKVEAYSVLDPRWCHRFDLDALSFAQPDHINILRFDLPTDSWGALRRFRQALKRLQESSFPSSYQITEVRHIILPSEPTYARMHRKVPRFFISTLSDVLMFTANEWEPYEEVIQYFLGKAAGKKLSDDSREFALEVGLQTYYRLRGFFAVNIRAGSRPEVDALVLETPFANELSLQTVIEIQKSK